MIDGIISYLEGRGAPKVENDVQLFSMILASDYLQLPELVEEYSSILKRVLSSARTAEEVRKMLNVSKDLSVQEEFSASKEAPWEDYELVGENINSPDMTVSMMVDGGSQFRTATSDSMYSPPLREDLEDIVKFVQPRRPMAPIPDEHAPVCSKCVSPFGRVLRRHHCRRCGMWENYTQFKKHIFRQFFH